MARILIVDDSMFARMNICSMLEEAGHECFQASNGREGLAAIVGDCPDCVLTDLLMPELDGIGLLTAVREQNLPVPVIVLTADIQDSKRRQCLDLGIAGFISKPPRKSELVETVAAVLAGSAGQ
jgi:CheY-like chemotaxis protein